MIDPVLEYKYCKLELALVLVFDVDVVVVVTLDPFEYPKMFPKASYMYCDELDDP